MTMKMVAHFTCVHSHSQLKGIDADRINTNALILVEVVPNRESCNTQVVLLPLKISQNEWQQHNLDVA
jgi:hypothetical protein